MPIPFRPQAPIFHLVAERIDPGQIGLLLLPCNVNRFQGTFQRGKVATSKPSHAGSYSVRTDAMTTAEPATRPRHHEPEPPAARDPVCGMTVDPAKARYCAEH